MGYSKDISRWAAVLGTTHDRPWWLAPVGAIVRIVVVKLLRRIAAALAMAGIAAAGIRLRGSGGVPPQHGGWRPLELPPDP